MSVNKAILVGNVGKDPEVRYLESGVAVCNFPLATSETYKNRNGETITNTEWHNIVLWRGLAEIAEKYIKKGKQLYIEGRIRTRSWDDNEGNKRYITEIVGDNMQMLGRKQDDENQGQQQQQQQYAQSSNEETTGGTFDESSGEDETDDLPF
jgi:single-strand DNA-binding protein